MPFPCNDCCDDDEPCEGADCGHCANTAPTCWRVVIAGIVAEVPEICESCTTLNRVYYLHQDSLNPCRWICKDVSGVDCEDSDEISLTVYRDGEGNYKIRVELGDHRWIGDYGATAISCCEIVDDELDHDRSGSDCDSTASTCTITRRTGDGYCPCIVDCDDVLNAPPCFLIEWVGMSNRSPLETGDCKFCDCYTTTPQRIPHIGSCDWNRSHLGINADRLCSAGTNIRFRKVSDSIWRVEVSQKDRRIIYQKDYNGIPDVLNWSQEEIPKVVAGPGLRCDYDGDAKVLLTPDYATACDDQPWGCRGCLCQQDDDPPDVQVTLEGWRGNPCCDGFDGTFILQPVLPLSTCRWEYIFGDNYTCQQDDKISLSLLPTNLDFAATLTVFHGGFFTQFTYTGALLNCHSFDVTFNGFGGFIGFCFGDQVPFPRIFTL